MTGKTAEAELIGRDTATDIAVLKVDVDEPLTFATFGDSNELRVGDWVVAIGNPLGQEFSVSAGIVSARGRSLQGVYDDYIQTDAAINRGNSGGPLFNLDGEVIGVNTIIISTTGASIGLGFSMSSRVVGPVVEQLMEYGETRRGWLGVVLQEIDADLADALQLDEPSGALVSSVPDGPAKIAGILDGDVIMEFDGHAVSDVRTLVAIVGRSEVGKTVRVVVIRDGVETEIDVVLGRRELAVSQVASVDESMKAEPVPQEHLGMELSELNDELREEFEIGADAKGVLVLSVDPNSDAFGKGIRRGDRIVEVGTEEVTSADDLESVVAEYRSGGGETILLLIEQGAAQRFVALSIAE